MAQANEIKKNWIDLESIVIENLESLEIPEVEEISIEKEVKKATQVKLKKFSKLISKITRKSKYNANYMKEQISIKILSNAPHRIYAVY
jgi:hypothetical protein